MKKMRGKDLTPEIVKQLSGLNTVEEAVKYLIDNGFLYKKQDISDVMAKVRER